MSDSGVWDLDIAGSGSGSEIENRLNTLENTIHEYEIYELISTGTAGTVTKPTHGTILLDQYPAGGDCIVVQTDSTTQKPIEALVYDASGVLVEGTLDINGNYTLSGVPATYPVALVFQVSLAEMYKTLELSNDKILTEMRIPNAGVTSHEDLSNINQAGTGVLNGHISDQAQTIAGAKTFSDTIIGSINGNADTVTNGVYTIDDQTITGVKTFNSSPIIPDATTATQAVSKGQLDTVDLKTTSVDCTSRVAEYTGDGGGATILDRAGNGNNLAATNITYVNGKYGKEMSFDGSTSYAQASSPVIGTTGTVACRFKLNTHKQYNVIYANYISKTTGAHLSVDINGSLSARVNPIFYPTPIVLSAGIYYSVVVQWDGSVINIYINGVLTHTAAQEAAHVVGLNNLAIGRDVSSSANFLDGNISHFRYDSRIWTADEARAWSLNPSVEDSPAMSETHSAGDVMVWPSVIYNTSNRTLNGGITKVVEIYKQPKIRQISGVIRYYNDVDGSGNPGWNLINNHYALGLGLQVGATSSVVNLTWTISDFVNPRVVSFVCTPDEGYAKMGLFCGASVARNSASISLYAGERGDYITYNSDTGLWNSSYGNITAVWNGSLLHVSISAVEMGGAKLIYRNYPFPTIGNRCGAIGTVQVEGGGNFDGVYKHTLSFWDHAGTQITSPQAGMRFWIKTGIPRALNPLTDFSGGNSNIWFNGYIIDADSVGG